MRALVILVLLASCKKADDDRKPAPAASVAPGQPGKAKVEQIPPPFDVKSPPADATKLPSGLTVKKLTTNDAGAAPKRNDTVMVNLTSWRGSDGETMFSNRNIGKPMPLNLSTAAAGFVEGMQMVKKGEKAMLWVPPELGYRENPTSGSKETMVYEIELVDIVPAPAVPTDLSTPPATALATASGIKYIVLRPGTGTEKAKPYDNVTFNYTGWDSTGRMFDSTETKNKTAGTVAPFRQPKPFADVLTSMTAGQRVRFWVDAKQMQDKPLPNSPTGILTYEAEVLQIQKGVEPPQTPPDVAKPPADAKKTAKGVFYRVLRAGKGGAHPKPSDTVKVHYTGWRTNGEMFDSSVTRGEPATFSLGGVIAGWTDGLQVMSPGDKVRFWIPDDLAYKGSPEKPQGMLVFDIELLEIMGPPNPDGPHGPHGHP